MNKEQILETLIVAFYGEMQSVKACKRHGYMDLANQACHQALGIQTAAEALGIDYDTFMAAYKEHRSKMNERALHLCE